MTRNTRTGEDRLAADIRRQFKNHSTARFLRGLPAFKVVTDIPDHLGDLLERLDVAENCNAGRNGR